jgi:uncharacterized protein (DUF2062 family)
MSTEKKESFVKRFGTMVMGFLKQGTSPKKLALTISIGIIMGIIPLVGVNAAICAVIALIFGLNLPLIQIVNLMFFPIQIVLIVPFFKLSTLFFKTSVVPVSWSGFVTSFKTDWLVALKQVAIADAMAITAWLVLAVPLFVFLYVVIHRILLAVKARKAAQS